MKKIVIILAIIIGILSIQEKQIIIPKDTIRFRIIANSNIEEDQELKKEIIKRVKQELIRKETSIDTARINIKRSIPKFEEQIQEVTNNYTISYGQNYFPQKVWKKVIFPEGEYESLVITLGEGEGENFWCILFPPLCMIDENEEEYPSLIKEVLNRYL